MESNINRSNRLVIPKWRDYENTKKLGELKSVGKKEIKLFEKEFLNKKYEWRRNKDFISAMELLIYKEIDDPDVLEAVKFLQNYKNNKAFYCLTNNENKFINIKEIGINLKIAQIRKILEKYPRNAIRWVDLSLCYTTIGEEKKAINAMKVAVQLDKNNRFVIRSGVRLFLHYNQCDYAYYLLKNTNLLNHDPWINAAYIAVSQLLEKNINNLKESKYFVESNNFSKFDISELACSIGTLQLAMGKDKEAKKMIKESIIEPNDNAAAQLQWISKNIIKIQDIEKINTEKIKNNYEFETIQKCYLEDFENAIKNAEKWIEDESISTVPNLIASSIYTSVFEDYEKGEEKVKEALKKEKNNIKSNIQLAFCKINKGELDTAEELLNRIEKEDTEIENKIIILADKGMLNFRNGREKEGEIFYREAAKLASKNGMMNLKASAIFHLAKEKNKIKSATFFETISEAKDLYKYIDDPVVLYNIKKFEKETGV